MSRKYVPGKCNIGTRGRAIRVVYGLAILAPTVGLGVVAVPSGLFRLLLAVPAYMGLLAMLEGASSFCLMGARMGAYDFHEGHGLFLTKSPTRVRVEDEEWRRKDRRKALLVQLETALGAILLAVFLVLV